MQNPIQRPNTVDEALDTDASEKREQEEMNDQTPQTIGQKIARALENAMELRIVTVVGDATVGGRFPHVSLAFDGSEAKAIATSIDLVQGDTNTVISPAFSGDAGESLRKFHAEQVAEGKAIVERNVRLLVELGREIVSLVKDMGEASEK